MSKSNNVDDWVRNMGDPVRTSSAVLLSVKSPP